MVQVWVQTGGKTHQTAQTLPVPKGSSDSREPVWASCVPGFACQAPLKGFCRSGFVYSVPLPVRETL